MQKWHLIQYMCVLFFVMYHINSNKLEKLEFNSSPPAQNGRYFAHDIFRCIFVTEKFFVLIKISLKFVPKGPIDNIPALV